MKLIQLVSVSSLFCLSTAVMLPKSYAQTNTTQTQTQQSQLENKAKLAKIQLVKQEATKATELFFNEDYAKFKEMIHPDIRDKVTIELLQKEYSEIVSSAGDFKQIKSIQVIDSLASDVALVTIEFANITKDWTIIFDNEQQMLGTDFIGSRDIDEIALEFVESLSEGKYDYARSYLHPFLKERIFPQEVQARWQKMEQTYGKFEKIVDSNIRVGSSLEQLDLVFVNVQFENETRNILFSFDRSKNITNVDMFQN